MKLYARLPSGQLVEVDEPEQHQIANLKDTLSALLTCSSDCFDLYFNGSSLWVGSTLEQNGISEFSIVDVIPTVPGTSNGDNEIYFTMDELLGPNSDNAITGSSSHTQKLLLPKDFDGTRVLKYTGIHHFKTAGQLVQKIGSDPPVWVDKLEAYTALSNPDIFCTHGIDDFARRSHGYCALVNSNEYEHILQGPGYKYQKDSSMNLTLEKFKRKYKITAGVTLDLYEIKGDLWLRRRYVLTGDGAYSFIQWLQAKPKEKSSVRVEMSCANERLTAIEGSMMTMAADVSTLSATMSVLQKSVGEPTNGICLSSAVDQLTLAINALMGQMRQLQQPPADAYSVQHSYGSSNKI